jgi:hypothetical protein
MPRVHFAAPHPLFGRPNKRLPASYQQRSPYYWWWAYLRRSAAYLTCCERAGTGELAELYADFGDVRTDDFHHWWTQGSRGVRLFAEQPLAVKFSELASAADWQPQWHKDQVMVVAVPLNVSKRRLKGAFAALLDHRHTGHKSGRPSLAQLKDTSTARYKLERNYTIASLRTTLAVYDLWMDNQSRVKDSRMTLWEIGKTLNLNKQAISDAESKTAADRYIGRNVLAATVSRNVRQAKSMIANVEQRRFPLL